MAARRFVHCDSPSSRCEVRRGIGGFGDAALCTTLVAIHLVVLYLQVVYFNSTKLQPGSRNVLVGAHLLGQLLLLDFCYQSALA